MAGQHDYKGVEEYRCGKSSNLGFQHVSLVPHPSSDHSASLVLCSWCGMAPLHVGVCDEPVKCHAGSDVRDCRLAAPCFNSTRTARQVNQLNTRAQFPHYIPYFAPCSGVLPVYLLFGSILYHIFEDYAR